jgi:F-type H+-transporting ATPase subunit b
MLINWFTLVAQLLNFLILLWLLNKFLYKPVLKSLDERENRIAAVISDAESMKLNAKKELEEYSAKNASFDKERESIIQHSRIEAEQERITIIKNAKNAAQQLIDKQKAVLIDERDTFYHTASTILTSQILRITEKTISMLSDSSLEAQLANKFINNIKNLTENERNNITDLLTSSGNHLCIRSSMPLENSVFSDLEQTLKSIFGLSIVITSETAPSLLCGMELIIDTYKLSWNAHDFIQKTLIDLIGNTTSVNAPIN